jgi:hypothetical protein
MGPPNEEPVLLWLLEENNPPVRFLTLKNLLNCPPDDRDLNDARLHLMDYSVTQGILDHFDSFISADSFSEAYSKYKTYHALYILNHFQSGIASL